MGWLFCEPTRKALITRLVNGCNTEHCRLRDYSTYGNEFYAVVQNIETGNRVIVVCLMQGDPKKYHHEDIRWGYKDMDESCGPYVLNCPERLLAQSDCQHERAVEWRQKCRSARASKAAHKAFIRSLQYGQDVSVGGMKATFLQRMSGRYKANLVCRSDMGTFRYKPSSVRPYTE